MPLSIFVLPVGIVIILFILTRLLFNRLETQHSETYEELGSPSFRAVNGFAPIFTTLKFIFRREHKALNDSYLSNVSDAMLVLFAIYIVLFAYEFFVITAQQGWRGSHNAA
jgi:TRAP-type C4-dicarboxylate transport system permease small subunit